MRVRHAFRPVRVWRAKGPLGLAVAAALTIGIVQGVPAQAAPPPDPVAAEEQAREAASEEAPAFELPAEEPAPEIDTTGDQSDEPTDDEFAEAWEQSQRTGKPVELESQTTETTISHVQPDGTVEVESTAGPVRTQVDGDWVDVDTTLHFTDAGVQPVAVTGEITFSDGGTEPMAVLGDGDSTELSLDWAGRLPKPVLEDNTATYRNVIPGVDLVLLATRLGFQQHLVVKERPSQRTLSQLRRLQFPMAADGAIVIEGAGGELQVVDESGAVVGNAAAPVMWDSRTDRRTGDPVAVTEMGLDLAAPTEQGADATLVLTPSESFLTDPATVYPVTIDPTQALGSLGDTFVQSNIANTAQGGSTEIRAGTYDGPTAARGYLKFDVTPVKNRVVQAATLSLWEFHSWSCTARRVDIHNVGNFDPNTLTWGTQPAIGGSVANATVAYGYSTACPDNWVNFNLTSWVSHYSDAYNGSGNIMPLGVFANEDDVYAWKKFNSGNSGVNVPKLTFTYDGNCDQYRGMTVCGAIRTKWQQLGGSGSFLGLPSSDYTATSGKPGYYNHFAGGSIFWSSATGAHVIRNGAMRDRYSALGWHNSYLGFPSGDMTSSGGGWYEHFEGGTMFWTSATGAKIVRTGAIRDKYSALGWHTGTLGFPTTDQVTVTGGSYNNFQNGSIYYSASTGAHMIRGAIRDKWNGMGAQASLLGFPDSDETAVTGGSYSHFAGGSIFYSAATGAHWLRAEIRDKYAALGWQASSLGFPTTDEIADVKTIETLTVADDGTETTTIDEVATGGSHNDFTGGAIYFGPDSGAHLIQGPIRDYWLESGAVGSVMGYPVGDPFEIPAGTRQDFVETQVIVDPASGGITQCTITGTAGPDEIAGTDSDDVICGLDGDDALTGLAGNDVLLGGGGNDTVAAGSGSDAVEGGDGADTLSGGLDDDEIVGGGGDDALNGDEGADSLYGDVGIDQMSGGDGDDSLFGGEGADTLGGGAGADTLNGDASDDALLGDEGSDTLSGGEGDDDLSGGLGDDDIAGNDGDDVLAGGDDADRIAGGVGTDELAGGGGEDELDGGPTSDAVDGGADDDSCITASDGAEFQSCEVVHVNSTIDNAASYITSLAPAGGDVTPAQAVGGELVATSDTTTVSAPLDSSGAVELTAPAAAASPAGTDGTAPASIPISTTVAVDLPDLGSTAAGAVAADGSVIYQNPEGPVDIGVQTIDSSVRIATVIKSPDSPTRFDYTFALPPGGSLELSDDGFVAMRAADGSVLGGLAPAWAKDALGAELPTHYEINGPTVTQVVDISDPAIVYPVVADPWWGQNLISSAKWVLRIVNARHETLGWTLEVTPTKWARAMAYYVQYSYDVGAAGWTELYNRYRNSGRGIKKNLDGMRDQYICHQQVVGIRAPNKPTWNLDEWRPNYSYLSTVNAQCNPGGPVWFD